MISSCFIMMQISYTELRQKILSKSELSEKELDEKIQRKLDQLSGLISKEGAAHIIANEYGVKLFESGKLKISSILSGMRNVEAAGKVLAVYEKREFQRGEGTGKVASFLMGDETGTIRVVCWGEQAEQAAKLTPDTIVRVVSGYTKDNSGRREIHLNERSKIILNPEGVSVGDVKKTFDIKRKKIQEVTENDRNIELLGTIVHLEHLRFFEVCPQCGKRAREKQGAHECEAHGPVDPDYSYVCSLNLDDGSGNMRVVLFREFVEQLLQKSKQEVIQLKNAPEDLEGIRNELLGETVKVQGRANKNTLFDRMEFVVSALDKNPDPQQEMMLLDQEKTGLKSVEDL